MKQLEQALFDLAFDKGFVTKQELLNLSQSFNVSYDVLLELSKNLKIDFISQEKILQDLSKIENESIIREQKSPLLSKEEELQLFKKLESLREELSKLNKDNPLELKLYKQYKKEIDNIKLKIININTPLIKFIAKKFSTRNLQFDDLISEGKLGMQAAIASYDVNYNVRFSTYAYYKVYQAVKRIIQNYDRSIRIPVHIVELTTKVIKCSNELANTLGHKPSTKEIAETLNITTDYVEKCILYSKNILSLDNTIDDEDKTSLQDILSDYSTLTPYEASERKYAYNELLKALENIGERERDIFMLRYGLRDGKTHNLEQIGAIYGLSKERIRQIIEFTKVKLNRIAPHLKDFVGGGKNGK